ncbi:GTP-binding protein [Chitinimonas sp. BJYL2]|uniref:CobW family GTP-binding protein n=1 Tax=Chitinimonas sp. BJYL2 TaxID=2976696 RepID=UPI0022B5B257|nr:GTP-binding protein [Chitinimonas sp. BJYL2]
MNPQRVPVNLITGFLGVGKTTAIRRLLAEKPADEFWAVLVNEFGEVGIDGAAIESASDQLNVVEVPGGCICCTTSPMLRVSLTKLLRQRRPDRLLIEPSGLGHPAGIIDVLRDPYLQAALDVRATITLVDPRQLNDSRYTTHAIWRDQIALADVLIANKCDRTDAEDVDRFLAMAGALYPPKLAVRTTSMGGIARELLDLGDDAPATESTPAFRASAAHPTRPSRRASNGDAATTVSAPVTKEHQEPGQSSRGWLWPPEQRFFAETLAQWFQQLHLAERKLPQLQRGKGVFHTDHGWLLFNWVSGEVSAVEIAWRRDSRCELIVASDKPDWSVAEASLLDCLIKA